MHDRIDPMRGKNCIERCGVADVPFEKLTPANELVMAEYQIIKYNAFMARHGQRLGTMAADVAGTARDQNSCHDSAIGATLASFPNHFARNRRKSSRIKLPQQPPYRHIIRARIPDANHYLERSPKAHMTKMGK